jgi:DNA polymerase-3 subunit chi
LSLRRRAQRYRERIHAKGRRLFIHVPSKEEAHHRDRLLWTFRQQSFLLHGIVGDADPGLTPILIGYQGSPDEEDQVLIYLGRDVPTFFARFDRLAEPIDLDPEVRNGGRARYCYSRDRGYPLHHHEIQL